MRSETYVIVVTAALYLCFLSSLMSFTSIVLLHALPLPLLYFLYLRAKDLTTTGVLDKLPTPLQNALLNQSVIEVLAQLVAGNSFTKLLKALVLPNVFEMHTDEVHRLYSQVSPSLAEAVMTKGIIHTLPHQLQQILLPPKSELPKIHKVPSNSQLKTQLISSGGPPQRTALNRRLNEITSKIPSLKPLVAKMLSDKMRSVMGLVSNSGLKKASFITLFLFVTQLVLSRRMRRWTISGLKLAFLAGTVSVLTASLSGLFIKYLHTQSEPPQREHKLKHTFAASKYLALF
jgi:hypothetical protein